MKFILTALVVMLNFIALAQTDIISITTSYSTGIGTTYTGPFATGGNLLYSMGDYKYNFGTNANATNHSLSLLSFTAGGKVYTTVPMNPIINLVRGSAVANTVIYYEGEEIPSSGGIVSDFNLQHPYINNMNNILSGYNNFNTGVENLFINTGDQNGNNNNIEKVEVVFPTARTVVDATQEGIAIFERGAINQHDGFTVAIIQTTNGSNVPTAYYSTLKKMNPFTYGNTNLLSNAAENQEYFILRKPLAGTLDMRIASQNGGNMGGVFFKFSDFGIANGQTVKGYTILGGDLNLGSGGNILAYDDVVIPFANFTNEALGGLDMVALTGLFTFSSVVPLPPTLNASIVNNQVKINWDIQGNSFVKMEVQKSTDNNNFIVINTQHTNTNSLYSYTDINFDYPLQWYRIKFTNAIGLITYSNIIPVKKASKNNFVEILSAIPLANNDLTVRINLSQKETIQIKVFDLSGKLLLNTTRNMEAGNSIFQLQIPKQINNAIVLKVTSQNNSFSQLIL